MLYALIGVLAIIFDQWTKYWVQENLPKVGDAKALVPGIVSLQNVHNDGAAFGFLSGANAGKIFIILACVFTVAIVVGLITNFISGGFARWCAVFVAAGGIGNAIDRALYTYVQDMLKFEFIDFPVFNVADIYITVFCLLFILCIIFGRDKKAVSESEYEEVPEVEAPSRRTAVREAEPVPDEPVRQRSSARRSERAEKESRKERMDKYSDEFEQFKARKQADERSEFEEQRSAPAGNPFDEWQPAPAAPVEAQPAPAPAPKPAPKPVSSDDSFSLDDILAEFK